MVHLRKKNKGASSAVQKIITDNTEFYVLETYKAMRTKIMFSMPKTPDGKVIAITSSIPNEGKTTTSINLAITFAKTGAKVLIIDCDMRKSRIHRYLEIERGDGISNILCGFSSIEDTIKKEVRENLDVLTAGEIPPNPAELLQNEVFGETLAKLKTQYDYIFIDTPPMSVVTDAAIVMRLATGGVVVIRQDVTTFDVLDETMEMVKESKTKLIGVIIVGADEKKHSYGYYKNKKYSYKYKYKYDYIYSDDTNDNQEYK